MFLHWAETRHTLSALEVVLLLPLPSTEMSEGMIIEMKQPAGIESLLILSVQRKSLLIPEGRTGLHDGMLKGAPVN